MTSDWVSAGTEELNTFWSPCGRGTVRLAGQQVRAAFGFELASQGTGEP